MKTLFKYKFKMTVNWKGYKKNTIKQKEENDKYKNKIDKLENIKIVL